MSRIVRKQLFSIWESLWESHQVLASMMESIEKEKILELLADCQEDAIVIGGQIEEIYGGGSESVRGLEQYCEIVYHIAENVEYPEISGKYCKFAQQQLMAIKDWMEQEIPERMEMAFFPYKASMWDGMESIYAEARKDKNCDSYCVPIPYCNEGQEEWHDESKEYPAEISITDWKEYEFEVRKPDVIFIQNPYDDWKGEECVETRFYAANLRKYTEMLVYVPYISWTDVKLGGREAIEKWRYSCFLPGAIHADKVIIESEDMRSAYISEYKGRAEEQGIKADAEELEQKILALGSPKLDKPWNMQILDSGLPEEWKRNMFKPNGERKKVLFYYTSINALLVEREKLLDKIENVFSILKQRKDEVVLWWRPQSKIRSMLPQMDFELWNRYEGLEKQYKEEKWGIFDDTDKKERAALAMDGYYGDWSTWVWKCQEYRKPVMIQNPGLPDGVQDGKELWYRTLSFTDAWKDGEELWISNRSFNGIFKVNAANGKGEWIGRFEKEIGYERLHQQVLPWKDWLIFIPDQADYVAFFHKKTYETDYISIDLSGQEDGGIKAAGACIYEEELWIFPRCLSAVAIIRLDDRSVQYDDSLKQTVVKAWKSAEGSFFGNISVKGNEVWLPIRKTPEIIKYHMDKKEAEFVRLKDPNARIYSMDAWKDTFLITLCDRPEIVKWNPVTGEEEKERAEARWEKGKPPFAGTIPVSDSQCLILPAYGDGILLKTGNEYRKLADPDGFARQWERGEEKEVKYAYQKEGGKIFIFSSLGNMLLVYNIQTEELEGRSCKIPEDWSDGYVIKEQIAPYYMQYNLERKKEAYEESGGDLKEFLYWMENSSQRRQPILHSGEKIYRYFADRDFEQKQDGMQS